MVEEAAGERVKVVSSPFKLTFLSRVHISGKQEKERKDSFPVHRPSLKYTPDHRLRPLLCTSAFAGYTCGFLSYFAEVFYRAYLDRSHLLYRRNPTMKHLCYCLAGASKVATVGALPFALQCSILCGTEFAIERWRGKRDIYNLAMAGGLSFGALHLFSVENLIALSKKQARFQGRFLLMAVVGVAVGCFGHAAELAFFDIFQKHVLVSEGLLKDRCRVSSDNLAKMRSPDIFLDIDAVEESNW